MRKMRLMTIIAALSATAILPAAATAQTSDVEGTVGSSTTLSVTTPPSALTLGYGTNTWSSIVDVTSTATSWTLKAHDASLTTPGKMDRVDCSTKAATSPAKSLGNALTFSTTGIGTTTSNVALSGTAQTAYTGALVDAVTFSYAQNIVSGDAVASGECYKVTVTYTVT